MARSGGGSNPKAKAKKAEFRGFLDALKGFVNYLVEIERKMIDSGQYSGLGYSADYEYRTKIGISPEDFRRGYRKPRISKEKAKINKKNAGSMEVLDKGDRVSVVAYLPYEEKDIDFKVAGNKLKIAARTPKGRVEKKIPVKGGKIEGALFKNGVLEVTIERRR